MNFLKDKESRGGLLFPKLKLKYLLLITTIVIVLIGFLTLLFHSKAKVSEDKLQLITQIKTQTEKSNVENLTLPSNDPQLPIDIKNSNGSLICTGGQVWNSSTKTCLCPANTYLNDSLTCISCKDGTWNPLTSMCECPNQSHYDGSSCITCLPTQNWDPINKSCATCNEGVWNQNTLSCDCAKDYYYNGKMCVNCPLHTHWDPISKQCANCLNGRWNSVTLNCDCEPNFNNDGNNCVQCLGGQIWDPSTKSCICPINSYLNALKICMQCKGGNWNTKTLECDCAQNQHYDGNNCLSCSKDKKWDQQTLSCICPDNAYLNKENNCVECNGGAWNNYTLRCVCPQDLHYDGKSCVVCNGDKTWDSIKKICHCKTGYYLNQNGDCIQCKGGVWNFATLRCDCPVNQQLNAEGNCVSCPEDYAWNDTTQSCYKKSTELNCPISGTIYDYKTHACICDSNLVLNHKGDACICPKDLPINHHGTCITCGYKQYRQETCHCPDKTYDNGKRCVTCFGGQIWEEKNKQCECPASLPINYKGKCINCDYKIFYDEECRCPVNTQDDGTQCVPCNDKQFYDPKAYQCVDKKKVKQCDKTTMYLMPDQTCVCIGNKIMTMDNTCICPPGLPLDSGNNICVKAKICERLSVYNVYTNECEKGVMMGCIEPMVYSNDQKTCVMPSYFIPSLTSECPSGWKDVISSHCSDYYSYMNKLIRSANQTK